jgi:hypothetical protein
MPARHVAAVGFFGPAAFLRERLQGAVGALRGRAGVPEGADPRTDAAPRDDGRGSVFPEARLDRLLERLDGRLIGLLVAAQGEDLQVRLIFGCGRRSVTLVMGGRERKVQGRVATGAGDG